MKQALAELVQDGKLGQLEVIDVSENPGAAEQRGVRSVPWLQLGELVFEGAHSAGELQRWAEVASRPTALTEYFKHLLSSGELVLAERMLDQQPDHISALLPLLENPQSEMSVRIGIAALMETRRGTEILLSVSDDLVRLCRHRDPVVRADACHLLAQTESSSALSVLREMTGDESEQVREIASDSIEELERKRNRANG